MESPGLMNDIRTAREKRQREEAQYKEDGKKALYYVQKFGAFNKEYFEKRHTEFTERNDYWRIGDVVGLDGRASQDEREEFAYLDLVRRWKNRSARNGEDPNFENLKKINFSKYFSTDFYKQETETVKGFLKDSFKIASLTAIGLTSAISLLSWDNPQNIIDSYSTFILTASAYTSGIKRSLNQMTDFENKIGYGFEIKGFDEDWSERVEIIPFNKLCVAFACAISPIFYISDVVGNENFDFENHPIENLGITAIGSTFSSAIALALTPFWLPLAHGTIGTARDISVSAIGSALNIKDYFLKNNISNQTLINQSKNEILNIGNELNKPKLPPP